MGRVLFDKLSSLSERILLGRIITEDQVCANITDPSIKKDYLSYSEVLDLQPNVVYLEGGLFAEEDNWKIPSKLADEVCERGGAIIVADADVNELGQRKQAYLDASARLLKAQQTMDRAIVSGLFTAGTRTLGAAESSVNLPR
jgi:hypothetical protein